MRFQEFLYQWLELQRPMCVALLGQLGMLHCRTHAQTRSTVVPTKAVKYPAHAIMFSSLALFSSSMEQGAIRDGTSSIQARSSVRA
jgi:hypothetical protein